MLAEAFTRALQLATQKEVSVVNQAEIRKFSSNRQKD